MSEPNLPVTEVIEAALTWTGHRFESGIQVAVGAAGRIEQVGALGLAPTRRLAGQALLPGMVNVHSHAFQRGLRGRGERFPAGAGSFWSWREAMYALVEELDADGFYRLTLHAFREMLRSGITTVGEFHYFHHSQGAADWAFDPLVIEAAREAGIRLVLLNTYYRTGGVGRPLGLGQRRFATESVDGYWTQLDHLAGLIDPSTMQLGAVAHSIRAATPDEIAELHREATRRGLVFHIHVEEQRKEIEESIAAYGQAPMALLVERLETAANVTAVHCTHTAPEDMDRYLAAGGTVCLCPITEGNLGDGIPDLARVLAGGGRIGIGTDSNVRIAMPEEMRWLEFGQRLAGESRGMLRPADGHVARRLFECATTGGAGALAVESGRIVPGTWADFFTLDLAAPELAGWDESTLLDAFVFGTGTGVIGAVCVGGRWQEAHGGGTEAAGVAGARLKPRLGGGC